MMARCDIGQRVPFMVSTSRPPNMYNYSIKAVGRPINAKADAVLAIVQKETYIDQAGFYRVTGIVENRGNAEVRQPKVIASLYTRQGDISNVGFDYPEVGVLSPGEQTPFEIKFIYYPNGNIYQVTAFGQ